MGAQDGTGDENAVQKDGNRIVNSWSREVKGLEKSLAQAKKAHTTMTDEVEKHKNELDGLRSENELVKSQLEDVTAQARRALRDARTYEAEMAQYEEKSSTMCANRGALPSPRVLSKTLNDMIQVGEGRMDPKSRSQSPFPRDLLSDPRDRDARSRDD